MKKVKVEDILNKTDNDDVKFMITSAVEGLYYAEELPIGISPNVLRNDLLQSFNEYISDLSVEGIADLKTLSAEILKYIEALEIIQETEA